MKRAALYIRVSTMEQAKEGYSIPAQTDKLKAFAKAKDMAVTKIYTDPGFSGAKMERPALQEMISDIQNKKIDVVLVYKLDRLSRSQKNTLYLIEDVFLKNNVDFISMQESFDTSTPFGRATIGMLSVFAQLERDTITERMHMGRTERAKQGYYHGSGIVPLGYDYVDGELIINDYEAQIIQEIYDLYVNQGKGQQYITKRMVAKYPDKVKTLTIVKYALTNPLYIGKISWDGKVYDGHHTPIIDKSMYDKAQEIIARKAQKGGEQHGNQLGLLLGITYCGKCGAKVFRYVSGGRKYRYNYYMCRSVKKMLPSLVKDWNCKQPSLRQEVVEKKVIDSLKSLDFKKIERELKQVENKTKSKITTINNQISKKHNEKQKILDLYQYGTFDVTMLNERMKKIDNEINALTDNISNLEGTKSESLINKLETLKTFNWETETTENKILIIKEFVERIELFDDEVIIKYKF